MDTVYLNFSSIFNNVSHMILIESLLMYNLDGDSEVSGKLVKWPGPERRNKGQKVYLEASDSSIPQQTIVAPVLLNTCVNDLNNGVECILSGFVDDTKLGAVVDTPEGYAVIQMDPL